MVSFSYRPRLQFDAVLHALEQLPDQHPNRPRILALLGQIVDAQGNPAAAVRYMLSAIDLLEQHRDMLGYARTCNNLAIAYHHLQKNSAPDAPSDEDDITHQQHDLATDIRRLLHESETIQAHVGNTLGLAITRRNKQLLLANGQPGTSLIDR